MDNAVLLSPATLPAAFSSQVKAKPTAPFLHRDGDIVTYAEISSAVDSLATAWLDMGLTHGDRIAIAAVNSREWLITYLSAVKIGAVLVPLNVVYREREFTHMLSQSGSRILVCDAEAGGFQFAPFLAGVMPDTPTVERTIFIGAAEGHPGDRWEDLEATEANMERLAKAEAAVQPSDPAAIIYTSGTTGTPKGAVATHSGILASAAGQVETFKQTADEVILGTMPWNHVGGLTCTLSSMLLTGGSVALLPRFHPDLVAAAVKTSGVTMMVGVPTMYNMMLGAESFDGLDVSKVRHCVVGGSNVEPALAAQIATKFPAARLSNLYGLSETSGACIISPEGDSLDTVSTTIGTVLADFESRIVDNEGQPVANGESGELQIRGRSVAIGYWQMPEASAGAFSDDGWLSTGDICSKSDDGHISLMGRKKEMYLRGGYNVYPAEIENVLASHPTVAMGAVIGIPDSVFGEIGCAFIVPAPGATVDPEALKEHCRAHLADYKVPERIEIVASLPMTAAGKIRKVDLKAPTS